MKNRARTLMKGRPQAVAATLLSFTLIAATLYLAKAILIPLALALLLSFLLGPLVSRLDRLGLGRVASIVLCSGLVGLILVGLVWVMAYEVNLIVQDLPRYQKNIDQKLAKLQSLTEGGPVAALRRIEKSSGESQSASISQPGLANGGDAGEPVQVRVVPSEEPVDIMDVAKASSYLLNPVLEALGTAALSLVLVIFILFQREELRNRMVSFLSRRSLATPTKALDDAAHRISRYLLMQLIINGSFGVAIGIGLYVLGVPYAALWGLCAAVFRYIPYVGPWVAAILPILVAAISSPGWSLAIYVIGLFLVLELFSNNVLEPWLYGRGVGVSMVALLVAAAFWAWIWGPVGLILSTPLTVCVAVLGKYVPSLGFLDRLLSDAPALKPDSVYLQRLLARDKNEASAIIKGFRDEHTSLSVYENVLLPALLKIRAERVGGTVTADDEQFVLKETSTMLEELSHTTCAEAENGGTPDALRSADGFSDDEHQPAFVFGIPAHHESEELSLRMLEDVVERPSLSFEIFSTRVLPSDLIRQAKQQRPAVTVIAVLPPGGFTQARYLCRELRKTCSDMGIIVGCWGYTGDLDRVILKMRRAGANYVTTTLSGARSHLCSMLDAESRQQYGFIAPEEPERADKAVAHVASIEPAS